METRKNQHLPHLFSWLFYVLGLRLSFTFIRFHTPCKDRSPTSFPSPPPFIALFATQVPFPEFVFSFSFPSLPRHAPLLCRWLLLSHFSCLPPHSSCLPLLYLLFPHFLFSSSLLSSTSDLPFSLFPSRFSPLSSAPLLFSFLLFLLLSPPTAVPRWKRARRRLRQEVRQNVCNPGNSGHHERGFNRTYWTPTSIGAAE